MNNLPNGTPKTLLEAIIDGMLIGEFKDAPQNIESAVVDFLNQKLGWAWLKYSDNPEVMNALYELTARLGLTQRKDHYFETAVGIAKADYERIRQAK